MSFSDKPFPYGPFVPHWIPKQYIQNYFSWHGTDGLFVPNTTVEDVARVSPPSSVTDDHQEFQKDETWKLTLRRHDPVRKVDDWWEETFDAVIIANGHYSVPFVSQLSEAFLCFALL